LFRHPNAELFRIKPFSLSAKLKSFIPNTKEAILLFVLILISSNSLVQKSLLETRLFLQAAYRQSTSQIQKQPFPKVLLVQIDNESRKRNLVKLRNIKPINHEYIASLINRLTVKKAKVIGIDYILDTPQGKGDIILANTLKATVNSPNNTWFTFAKTKDKNNELLNILPNITQSNWSLNGDIEMLPGYMDLSQSSSDLNDSTKFSTLLAISHQLHISPRQKNTPKLQFNLNSQTDFKKQINSFIKYNKNKNENIIINLPRANLQPITQLGYFLQQMWLHPIIDFSISQNQVYQPISVWQLLEEKGANLSHVQKQVVIIAAGGYGTAGIAADGEDNFDLPLAVKYWRSQQSQEENPRLESPILTGGEFHAYMVHHLLNNRLVIPIPDLWMVVLAIFLGKCSALYIQENMRYRWRWVTLLSLSTAIYGILSLQIYVTTLAILLPWVLPSLTVWAYVTPVLIKKKS
jgi:hypothetical protein